jgi:prepilin-type N-terminal cleavage/methylation domain-containing protein
MASMHQRDPALAAPRVRTMRAHAGLSIIELVVVIAIILILATLVLTAAARIYKAVKALGGENQEQHQQQPVPQRGSTTPANPTGPR